MLKLDLSQYITSYKKNCIVKIREEWTTINDLQKYIKQIFKLKKIEFTDDSNCWLPGTESIDIIKKKDKPVKLIGVGIKPKYAIDKTITDNTTLKLKKYIEIEKSSDDHMNDIINVVKSKRKRKHSNTNYKNTTDNLIPNILAYNETSTSVKKKHRRHKKKNKHEEIFDNEPQVNVAAKLILAPNSATSKSPTNEISENHLRFDEFGNAITDLEIKRQHINFKNFFDTLHPTKPRIFSSVVVEKQDELEENDDYSLNKDENDGNNEENCNKDVDDDHVIIEENKVINNGFELLRKAICAPIENDEKSEQICDEETDEKLIIKSNIDEIINDIFQHEDKSMRILSKSKLLTDLPIVDDIIFFKICKLNNKCEPCLSDYICGKLEEFLEIDTEYYLKLYIIAGQEELEETFALELEFDNSQTDYLKIHLDKLHKPRILNNNLEDNY